MQELILTDDTLQVCDFEVFKYLFDALTMNKYSSLTLIDLSRNIHTFDNEEATHEGLIEALESQKQLEDTETDPKYQSLSSRRTMAFGTSQYLEQLWITTSNPKVSKMY